MTDYGQFRAELDELIAQDASLAPVPAHMHHAYMNWRMVRANERMADALDGIRCTEMAISLTGLTELLEVLRDLQGEDGIAEALNNFRAEFQR